MFWHRMRLREFIESSRACPSVKPTERVASGSRSVGGAVSFQLHAPSAPFSLSAPWFEKEIERRRRNVGGRTVMMLESKQSGDWHSIG